MRALISLAALAAAAALPAQAEITVGTANSDNCLPFGCGASFGHSAYQQVYNGSAFSGPQTIDTISFSINPNYPGVVDTNAYAVTFYYSSATAATITTNFAANRGTLLSDFGTFSLSGQPTVISLTGNGFTYDPAQGSLLMDVFIGQASYYGLYDPDPLEPGYFDADDSLLVTNSVLDNFFYPNDTGLVTTFSNSKAGAVPEPATWAMMLAGFAVVGTAVRRARRRPAALA